LIGICACISLSKESLLSFNMGTIFIVLM
jgi:hypothetical protein